ncbi:MAG: SDR family oxidoreductase [Pseudomonadota bacterium]
MTLAGFSRALVTGATSGIGAVTVQMLRAEGIDVLAVARRTDKLTALAEKTGCRQVALDVRKTAELGDRIAAFEPDIVVNNAGVGHGVTGIDQVGPDEISLAIETNLIAPLQITARALETMRRHSHGHIVNIGSIAGLHTMLSAVYGASKAAIHRFSQNLRYELRGTGIRVTEICPGRVTTEFYDAASGNKQQLEQVKHSGIEELQPEDVANAILFALQAPPHVNISTIEILPTEQSVGGVVMTPTAR